MAPADARLEIKDLVVKYGHLTAVAGISFSARAGEVDLLLGANGAGKSSTLKAISGAVKPVSGTVLLDGARLNGKAPWRVVAAGVSLVPEGRRIIGRLTVEENLQVGGYANRSAESRRRTMGEVYDMFPVLAERRRTPGGMLSGGEQQMLAFGRSLMSNPSVMLLDEPSMGLAPVMVDTVFEAVRQIALRGIAVVVVEQNAAMVELATRVHVLEQGRIVLNGDAHELMEGDSIARAFLGVSDSASGGAA